MTRFADALNLSHCAQCNPRTHVRACDTSWQPQLSPQKRFKSAMKQYYSTRSTTYDQEGGYHPKMVKLMIDLADLRPGHRCLDLCTGTGQVALRARQRIGCTGSVVAVDFSRSMLDVAAQKLKFANVTLLQCDVETLPSSLGKFDRITCASGLVLLRDITKTLRSWRNLLSPDGLMILDGPDDDAFIPGILAASAALKIGLSWPIDQVLGSEQRAIAMLEAAGLQMISFNQQPHRSTVTLSKLENSWSTIALFVHPVTPPALRKTLRKLFMEKAADYMRGREEVWNDNMMNFVVAKRKSL